MLPNVSRETEERLRTFLAFLTSENARQNLIAKSTERDAWTRHVVDSLQLLPLARAGNWLDLGSGPGFPGLVVAAAGEHPVTLVESRTKRVAFLHEAAAILGVAERVTIHHARVQMLPAAHFANISARAFAPLPQLFSAAAHQASPATRWLLPKGRSAARELEEARATWHGEFEIVPSVTDPESGIVVATNVRPKGRR